MPAPSLTDDQRRITVLIFGGGDPPTTTDRSRFPSADVVIAADHGADHALACGLTPDVVIGDLDSVSVAGLERAAAAGATIARHAPDKDESDLELALLRARQLRPARIVVTAVRGGRADHELANLLVIAQMAEPDVAIDVVSGSDRFHPVRGARCLAVQVDQVVTLLPMLGPAIGVRTVGLHYPLAGETLDAGSTRGISNIAVGPTIEIEVAEGVLLVVIPGENTP